jgi:hypothetical protein
VQCRLHLLITDQWPAGSGARLGGGDAPTNEQRRDNPTPGERGAHANARLALRRTRSPIEGVGDELIPSSGDTDSDAEEMGEGRRRRQPPSSRKRMQGNT